MTNFKPVKLTELTQDEINWLFESLISIPQTSLASMIPAGHA
jgi:hypothetical protein